MMLVLTKHCAKKEIEDKTGYGKDPKPLINFAPAIGYLGVQKVKYEID